MAKKSVKLKDTGNDPNSVLIICAHSDDHIFGLGGTIAKYAREGKKVHTVIFSYGEMSHPLHQREYIIKRRVKEAHDVDKYVGGSGVIFLGLSEGRFLEQFSSRHMYSKLKKLILLYKPHIIFTHSNDDTLQDHRAVNKSVLETLDKMRYKCEVYAFDIWTVFNFKKRHYVHIIIDISDTFKTKLRALKMFESQKATLFSLMWSVYFKAWINGRKIKARYAESFYKIR